jgi:hypothetical protein
MRGMRFAQGKGSRHPSPPPPPDRTRETARGAPPRGGAAHRQASSRGNGRQAGHRQGSRAQAGRGQGQASSKGRQAGQAGQQGSKAGGRPDPAIGDGRADREAVKGGGSSPCRSSCPRCRCLECSMFDVEPHGGDRPRPSPSIARRQRSGSGVEVAATGVRGLHVERASIIWDALRVGTGRAPPRTRVGAHGLRRATLAAAFADGHPLPGIH